MATSDGEHKVLSLSESSKYSKACMHIRLKKKGDCPRYWLPIRLNEQKSRKSWAVETDSVYQTGPHRCCASTVGLEQ